MHGWLKLAEADVEGTVDLGAEGEFDIGLTRSSGLSRQRHSWAAVTNDAIPMDAYEQIGADVGGRPPLVDLLF